MFPESLFAEIEPVVQADLPFEPPPPVTHVLRQEDASLVRPEISLGFMPRTNKSWEDLRVLLSACSVMLNARSVEDVEQQALALALATFPAALAAIRRTRNGVSSTSLSAREGHASKLTALGLDLVKRAEAELVSLLYLGDCTIVAAPLIAHGEVEGALVVESPSAGPRLGKQHLQLLTGLAAIVAPALSTQLRLRG